MVSSVDDKCLEMVEGENSGGREVVDCFTVASVLGRDSPGIALDGWMWTIRFGRPGEAVGGRVASL